MPGYFPNLKHLSVKCQVVYEEDEQIPSCFDVACGLSYISAFLLFTVCLTAFELDCKPAWRIIRQHLGNLPTLSPDLHTLSLHIRLRAHLDPPREWDLDTDLATAINELRLPALRDLTLNVQGMFIPPDLCLPRLRSFTGRFNDCATILENSVELHHLTVVFPEDEPMLPVWMSYPNYTVRSLDAWSVAADGRLCRYPSLISEATLTYLAVVLPNLTHLDVSLAKHMPRISFTLCIPIPKLFYSAESLPRRLPHAPRPPTPRPPREAPRSAMVRRLGRGAPAGYSCGVLVSARGGR
ncbi:hypothetical protein B0H16DRAFT_1567508 [Mycena metata]|uniref:Uncharacterized protein n=1 Tax=Mycena metata TaxID=1033252 RepID=A0AAD7ID37_9AGAR|nr:hypothetical protein B0H16DRAFT_1567508 [Mycena metata]